MAANRNDNDTAGPAGLLEPDPDAAWPATTNRPAPKVDPKPYATRSVISNSRFNAVPEVDSAFCSALMVCNGLMRQQRCDRLED